MSSGREIIPGMLKTGLGTLASRVLGLVRVMATTHYFGTTMPTDMLVISNAVPNLFRRLFGEGALNAAFVPVFAGETTRADAEARRLLNVVMTALTALLCGLMFLGWIVCVAALFSGRLPASGRLFFVLLAIQLPYLPLICLTALQAAALNVKGHFLRVAFAPTLMNIAWVIAAFMFGHKGLETGVTAVAVAVTISGVLQFWWQARMLRKLDMGFRVAWDLAHPGLRTIVALMGPAVVGLGVIQVNTFVDQMIAQFCVPGVGANSALAFGNQLFQFPLGVLGIALATAVFPTYTRRAALGDTKGLIEAVNLSLRTALFVSLPCMAAMIALSVPMVRVLFEHGKFTPEATVRTAAVSVFFSVGLWAFCGVQVLARAFYAQKDTRTPVRIALMMVVVNLALNLTLVWWLREAGLALSSSIAGAGNLALLFYFLRKRLGRIGGRAIAQTAMQCALASAAAGVAGYFVYVGALPRLASAVPARWHLPEMIALALALTVLGGLFLLLARLWRVRELGEFMQALRLRKPETTTTSV